MATRDEPTSPDPSAGELAADATLPIAENADGVDLTLVREYLALTPAERLSSLTRAAQALERLRQAKLVVLPTLIATLAEQTKPAAP